MTEPMLGTAASRFYRRGAGTVIRRSMRARETREWRSEAGLR